MHFHLWSAWSFCWRSKMIEEKVLKEIEDLKRAYLKKDKVYEAERKKLLELAEKYVAENDIRNDVVQLSVWRES